MAVLLHNVGPTVPAYSGRIYELRQVDGRWKLMSDSAKSQYTPAGTYTYVADELGTLWVSAKVEHIVLSGGRPVRYAGLARFSRSRAARGELVFWDNASGHYKPPADLARQAGLPMSRFVPRDAPAKELP